MPAEDSLIVVVNRTASDAENLKELIEFMDAPEVHTATPSKWRQQVGQQRLEAVFVGPDLSDTEVRTVMGDVHDLDPNIPIVMLREATDA